MTVDTKNGEIDDNISFEDFDVAIINQVRDSWYKLYLNGQKVSNTKISIAPIRIFLHGENFSGYFQTSDPL